MGHHGNSLARPLFNKDALLWQAAHLPDPPVNGERDDDEGDDPPPKADWDRDPSDPDSLT